MIIECPACNTRYDIKATLPPEGRTVRCAKCSTIWRAMPPESAGGNSEANGSSPVVESGVQAPSFDNASRSDNWSTPAPAANNKHEEFSDDQAEDDRGQESSAGQGSEFDHQSESDHRKSELAEDRQPATFATSDNINTFENSDLGEGREPVKAKDTEKVRWFSSFRRKDKVSSGAGTDDAAGRMGMQGETIPFPRSGLTGDRKVVALAEDEGDTLEDARQAVRSVFSSLGEVRPSTNSRAFSSPVTAPTPAGEEDDSASGEAPRFLAGRASTNGWLRAELEESAPDGESSWKDALKRSLGKGSNSTPGDRSGPDENNGWSERDSEVEQRAAHKANHTWNTAEESVAEESADPDTGLRDAMRAHLSNSPDHEGIAHDLETQLRSNTASKGSESWRDRTAALWKRPALPLDQLTGRQALEEEEESKNAKADDGAFDPRLYREIEETQEHAGDQRDRRTGGGLALAAAWGLFLCAASGLIVGFFAFRDIVADAVPGLAPFYRAVGTPVTVQPLIFESVQYEWTVAGNKPALVVSGSVFNRAKRKVKVPQFFITIKDEDPALDREYSANLQVGASKIKPSQRADFEIELLSPNPTITSVELELRNVR